MESLKSNFSNKMSRNEKVMRMNNTEIIRNRN